MNHFVTRVVLRPRNGFTLSVPKKKKKSHTVLFTTAITYAVSVFMFIHVLFYLDREMNVTMMTITTAYLTIMTTAD